jgi:hypothetical protein
VGGDNPLVNRQPTREPNRHAGALSYTVLTKVGSHFAITPALALSQCFLNTSKPTLRIRTDTARELAFS